MSEIKRLDRILAIANRKTSRALAQLMGAVKAEGTLYKHIIENNLQITGRSALREALNSTSEATETWMLRIRQSRQALENRLLAGLDHKPEQDIQDVPSPQTGVSLLSDDDRATLATEVDRYNEENGTEIRHPIYDGAE